MVGVALFARGIIVAGSWRGGLVIGGNYIHNLPTYLPLIDLLGLVYIWVEKKGVYGFGLELWISFGFLGFFFFFLVPRVVFIYCKISLVGNVLYHIIQIYGVEIWLPFSSILVHRKAGM